MIDDYTKRNVAKEGVRKAIAACGADSPITELHDEAMEYAVQRLAHVTLSDELYSEIAEMVNHELDGKLE